MTYDRFLLLLIQMLLLGQVKRVMGFTSVRAQFPNCRLFSTVSRSSSAESQTEKLLKRKVALCIAFVGTDYHGLQMNKNDVVVTVESVLENALYDLGCIKESNHKDLLKLGWSRSSRTDKGVHSSRLIISAKLELEPKWLLKDDGSANDRFSVLVERMNALLPEDIRVLSCKKIPGAFDARSAGFWREYEYMFPLHLLTPEHSQPGNTTALLGQLNTVLNQMQGSKSFHNFHKLSRRNLTPFLEAGSVDNIVVGSQQSQCGDGVVADDEEQSEENNVENLPSQEEEASDSHLSDEIRDANSILAAILTDVSHTTNVFEKWTPKHRDVIMKTQCNIYACGVAGTYVTPDGVTMVRLRIRGQSFLLNQIRLMVGSAIMTVRGVMPPHTIPAAFHIPYHITLPMAPAQGLTLVDGGFMKLEHGMYQIFDYEDSASTSFAFLTAEEAAQGEAFKVEKIYRRINADWARDNGELGREWLRDGDERFRVPPSIAEQWSQLLDDEMAKKRVHDEERRHKEVARVVNFVDKFHKEVDEWQALKVEEARATNEAQEARRSGVAEWKSKVPKKVKPFKAFAHGLFLPNGLATQMIIEFGLKPLEEVELLRALATMVVEGELRPNVTSTEIINLIRARGGLRWLQGVRRSDFIYSSQQEKP